MKHIFKKMSSVCAAVFCAASLTFSCAVTAAAEADMDASLKDYLITTCQSLTETIVPLSEDEIASYTEGGDEFTKGAMASWAGAKDELGELNELMDAEVVFSDGQYTVTVPGDFKDADANFVYVFDETGMPVSLTVDVQYPMSVTLQRAGMNTLMGIGTVFLVLAFLAFVIYLFRFIPGLFEGKKEKAAEAAPAAAPVQAAPAVEEVTDDTELIAVIAAAIAASEGTSPDGFVVRSIRKVNRRKW